MSLDVEQFVCRQPDPETRSFCFNQTMLRIKDPRISLDFYTRILGMHLIRQMDFTEGSFSLYFLASLSDQEIKSIPKEPKALARWMNRLRSVVELTHNWGTEGDPDFSYHNGNDSPRGFGHIGFSVPDLEATCQRFDRLGVSFIKRPEDGMMRHIAFIKDPDGYWVEVIDQNHIQI